MVKNRRRPHGAGVPAFSAEGNTPIDLADPVYRRRGALYAPLPRAGGELEHTVFLNLYSDEPPEKELNREIFHALWETERFSDDDVDFLEAAWPAWSGREGPPRQEDRAERAYADAFATASARVGAAGDRRVPRGAGDAAEVPGAVRAPETGGFGPHDIPYHEGFHGSLDPDTLRGVGELFGRIADGTVAGTGPAQEVQERQFAEVRAERTRLLEDLGPYRRT